MVLPHNLLMLISTLFVFSTRAQTFDPKVTSILGPASRLTLTEILEVRDFLDELIAAKELATDSDDPLPNSGGLREDLEALAQGPPTVMKKDLEEAAKATGKATARRSMADGRVAQQNQNFRNWLYLRTRRGSPLAHLRHLL